MACSKASRRGYKAGVLGINYYIYGKPRGSNKTYQDIDGDIFIESLAKGQPQLRSHIEDSYVPWIKEPLDLSDLSEKGLKKFNLFDMSDIAMQIAKKLGKEEEDRVEEMESKKEFRRYILETKERAGL